MVTISLQGGLKFIFIVSIIYITVAYPGFSKGWCLTICARSAREKLEATPICVDHTHHFRPLLGVHY